jgi:hypothetical protein
LGGAMSLYLQFGLCYVFVPSVRGCVSLCSQLGKCYAFVPSVWET